MNKNKIVEMLDYAYFNCKLHVQFAYELEDFRVLLEQCREIQQNIFITDDVAVKVISAAVQGFFEYLKASSQNVKESGKYASLQPILEQIWEDAEEQDFLDIEVFPLGVIEKMQSATVEQYKLLFGSKELVEAWKNYFLNGEPPSYEVLQFQIQKKEILPPEEALCSEIEMVCKEYVGSTSLITVHRKCFKVLSELAKEVIENKRKLLQADMFKKLSALVQGLFEFLGKDIVENQYKAFQSVLDKIWGVSEAERVQYKKSLSSDNQLIEPEPLLKAIASATDEDWNELFSGRNNVEIIKQSFQKLASEPVPDSSLFLHRRLARSSDSIDTGKKFGSGSKPAKSFSAPAIALSGRSKSGEGKQEALVGKIIKEYIKEYKETLSSEDENLFEEIIEYCRQIFATKNEISKSTDKIDALKKLNDYYRRKMQTEKKAFYDVSKDLEKNFILYYIVKNIAPCKKELTIESYSKPYKEEEMVGKLLVELKGMLDYTRQRQLSATTFYLHQLSEECRKQLAGANTADTFLVPEPA